MGFKFERLEVWKKSIELADELMGLARDWPTFYWHSLSEQLSRAVLSVPTNIAEGSGRDSTKSQQYFYSIAKGSVYEVVSLLVIAGRHELISREDYADYRSRANEIAAMLTGLINKKPESKT